ncbi:MAG: polysaccharide biosynthesis C-terminal domain-containing protein, partial [Oscillospiraceae bacterium]
PYASAAAIFGVTISTFVGTAFLLLRQRAKGDDITDEDLKYSPKPMRTKTLIIRLIKIAIPISLGSIVMNVAQLIDTLTIINRLDSAFVNHSAEMTQIFGSIIPAGILAAGTGANFIFGSYSGYALSVFNLVPAFTGIFGKSALPNVTAAWESKNLKAVRINVESVIRMTSLIAVPASFGIFFMAKPILTLLYPGKLAEVAIASGVLSWQGLSLIFLGLTVPLFAVLQGLGRADLPPKFMLVGATLKFVVNWVTIGIPSINVNGAAAGTAICYISILVLCLINLKRITGIPFQFIRLGIKPIVSGLLCGLAGKFSYDLLGNMIHGNVKTLIAIAIAGVVYVFMLLLVRGISKDDILMLPKGEKFAKLLA